MQMIAGELKLDQPAHLNDGLVMADGCFPIANGYAPLGQFAAFQNGTLAARCIGAGGYRYTGSAYLFAVTTTNIYSYSSSGYTSLASGLAGTVSLGARFCPFGSYMMITNGVDPIKRFDPGTGTIANLGGTPPTARYLAVVRGFLVAGYAGNSPLRVAWSDYGNSAVWTAGGSSQAGQFDMTSGGDVTGLVGGEYGLIFQERRIVRMTYTADSAIWQFDEIATDCGCVAPKSLATFGKITFFWSDKGFMACDGGTIQSIGNEKVDRSFQKLLDRTYFDNMSAVVDPRNSLYIVTVPSANPTTMAFIYNYAEQKWTTATFTAECVFSALSLGVTLEDLDAIYGNLDSISISLDSAGLRGGYPLLLMFNGSHTLGSLSGSNMAASFVDGQKELFPGYRSRIKSVRPLTDGNPTVSIIGANALSGTTTERVHTARTTGGYFRMRESWNLTQVKTVYPAGDGWTYHQGYDIDARQGGHA